MIGSILDQGVSSSRVLTSRAVEFASQARSDAWHNAAGPRILYATKSKNGKSKKTVNDLREVLLDMHGVVGGVYVLQASGAYMVTPHFNAKMGMEGYEGTGKSNVAEGSSGLSRRSRAK